MAEEFLFVDFMYAVAVGAALPRMAEHLSFTDSEFWGSWFFIVAFLEDFYLYHTRVAPMLAGKPASPLGFVTTMLIVLTWYVSQAGFPLRPKWFLRGFAGFFGFKLLASMLANHSPYKIGANWVFMIPLIVGFSLSFVTTKSFFRPPWRYLVFLAPAWLVAVVLWWTNAPYPHP